MNIKKYMRKWFKHSAIALIIFGIFISVFGVELMRAHIAEADTSTVPQFGLNIGDYGRGHDDPQCYHNYIPSAVNGWGTVTDFWTPASIPQNTSSDSWYIGNAYHPNSGAITTDNGYASGDCVQFGVQQQNGGVYYTDFRVGIRVGEIDSNSTNFENGSNRASHCVASGNAMTAWTYTPWASQGGGSSGFAQMPDYHNLVCYQLEVQTKPLPAGVSQISGVTFGGSIDSGGYIYIPNSSNSCNLIFPGTSATYSWGVGPKVAPAPGSCPMANGTGVHAVNVTMSASTPGAVPVLNNIPTTYDVNQTVTTGTDGLPLGISMKNTGSVPWTSDQPTLVAGSQTGICPTGNSTSSCSATYIYSSSAYKLKHASGSFSASPDLVSYQNKVKVTTTGTKTVDCSGAFNDHPNGNGKKTFLGKVLAFLATSRAFAMIAPGGCITTYDTVTSYTVNGVSVSSPDIWPGQTVNFPLNSLTAPGTGGVFSEAWQMSNNGTLFGNQASIDLTVVAPNTPPDGAVEIAEDSVTHLSNIETGSTMNVSGWAYDAEDSAPVASVQVYIDNSPVLPLATLNQFRNDKGNNSGWSMSYAIPSDPNYVGPHIVTAKVTDSGGMFKILSGKNITVFTVPAISCPGPANNAFTGCYFNDQNLGKSVFTRTDSSPLNFNWGLGSPDASVPVDQFSARWDGNFNFSAGKYTFTMGSDDGARLYIDGTKVLDKWVDQGYTTYTYATSLSAGTHEIKMEYYENGGGAAASLSWVQDIDGGWSVPSASDCPTACDLSASQLTATCTNPTRQNNGANCSGPAPTLNCAATPPCGSLQCSSPMKHYLCFDGSTAPTATQTSTTSQWKWSCGSAPCFQSKTAPRPIEN